MSKTRVNIIRYISILMLVLSVFFFFHDWIGIKEKNSEYKHVKNAISRMRDVVDQLKDDRAEDEIDDLDLEFNSRELYDEAKDFVYRLKDMALSPMEIIESNTIIGWMADLIDEVRILRSDEAETFFRAARKAIPIFRVLFYMTIVINIIYIILRLTGRRVMGIVPFLLALFWLIMIIAGVRWLNRQLYEVDAFDEKEVFSVFIAPYLYFLFSLLSLVLGVISFCFTKKVPQGVGYNVSPSFAYRKSSGGKSTRYCKNCGAQLNGAAKFCERCGSRQ